jgi:hypothetical protein
MSFKSVKGLPERVRNIAKEIERINNTQHINPLRLLRDVPRRSLQEQVLLRRDGTSDDILLQTLRDGIQNLPVVLYAYADILEMLVSGASEEIDHRTDEQTLSAAKERLIRAVAEATDRPSYANVAKLLTAVYRRATGRLDAEVTTQSLVELHKAWQKKNLRMIYPKHPKLPFLTKL